MRAKTTRQDTTMKLLAVLVLVTLTFADAEDCGFLRDAVQFLNECGLKSLSICVKERVLTYIDKLPGDVEVGSMFTIKQTESNKTGRPFSSVVLPDEPRVREQMLDAILAENIYDYGTSHTFEFKIPSDSIKELRSADDEARKKLGKKKGMSLMLLLKLKAAIMGTMVIKLIGFLAFKALVIGKIALTMASVIGLGRFLENQHHSLTHRVDTHPYSSSDIHDRS